VVDAALPPIYRRKRQIFQPIKQFGDF